MPYWKWFISLASALFLALSCSQADDAAAPVAVEEKWSCFNGCYIFLSSARYGLMDEAGRVLVPCAYDSIEFLDNDTALLCSGDRGSLSDRSGRILCEGLSPDSLRLNYLAYVAQVREADRRSWEEVVNSYSQLCKACKSVQGRTLFRQEFNTLKEQAAAVKKSLESATGRPTPSQKARLEALSNDYRKAF